MNDFPICHDNHRIQTQCLLTHSSASARSHLWNVSLPPSHSLQRKWTHNKQNEWNKRIRLETNVREIASVCTAFVFAKLQAMVIMLLLLCCPLFRSSSSHRMRHQCPFVLSSFLSVCLSVFLPASSHSFNPSVRPFVLLCPPIPGLWSIRQNNSLKLISAQVKIHRNPFCGPPAPSLSLWVRGN